MKNPSSPTPQRERRGAADKLFTACLGVIGGSYAVLVVAMIGADLFYASPVAWLQAFASAELQFAIRLTIWSSVLATVLSLIVGVPLGYVMSRFRFPGKSIVSVVVDLPLLIPPVVIGLSLLVLFRTPPGRAIDHAFTALTEAMHSRNVHAITFDIPAVILAQFAVAAAFAARIMRLAFDDVPLATEQVALTLGCTRSQSFWLAVFPEASRGFYAAAVIAWARAFGEFGPILVFASATRLRTDVLSTSVFFEASIGNIEAAVAVSLLMIAASLTAVILLRLTQSEETLARAIKP